MKATAGHSDSAFSPESRRMRICHLIDSLRIGGSECQMSEVARRQKSAGYHVQVGCLREEGPMIAGLRDRGIRVTAFPPQGSLIRPRGLRALLRLASFLRRERFSILHCHDLWSNLMGVPAGRLARVPVVITSQRDLGHLDWYTPSRKHVIAGIHKLASTVLANSSAVRQFLVSELGIRSDHIRVIRNAVEAGRFRPRSSGKTAYKTVMTIANMNESVKGHAVLIEAAPTVVRDHPEVRFVFVGNGAKRPKLQNQVTALGLNEHFCFLGRRSDIADLLAESDLFVLPSLAEGMPNVILEAMAANVPVIASRVGGILDVIEDGINGLLVPPGDPAALGSAILRLLDNPALAEAFAGAGAETVRSSFSFERLMRDLDDLYDSAFLRLGDSMTRPLMPIDESAQRAMGRTPEK
jgi:L-malate glycosyltransferase